MITSNPFDALPLWALFLLTVLIALLAAEGGYGLGLAWRKRRPEEKEGAIGAMTGATLGLLAFLVAFVTSMTVSRFDTRRQLVIDEANAIGTTWLRAGYLDEPYRTEIRDLLRDYVDGRANLPNLATLTEVRARSEQIHGELWTRAEAVARQNPDSTTVALFISSLNDTLDLHTKRLIALTAGRLPETILFGIYLVAFLAMAVLGFQNSFHGKRNEIAIVAMVLVFSLLILLIIDLDRPGEGLLRVSQQAMIDLQQQLHNPLP
jgi:hypothetical protein